MRKMISLGVATLLLTGCGASFDNSTCKTFMVGTWKGSGVMNAGRRVKVEILWVLRADGTFEDNLSYEKADGTWEPRQVTGTFVAEPGEKAGQCKISQVVEYGTGSSSVTVKDKDTVESFGVALKRQP